MSGLTPTQLRSLRAIFFAIGLGAATGRAAEELVAPPLQLAPQSRQAGTPPAGARVVVREFRFEGNTVFPATELARITAPYLNRELANEDIEEARRAVTLYYVNHGYLNSGAVLPDQDLKDGIVTIKVIEGKVSGITVEGNRWLRESYLRSRLEARAGPPLNINELTQGLLLLRQNPNIQQINAELRPGVAPGESSLDVRVRDQQPFRLGLEFSNDRPPIVGSEEIVLHAADRNLTGNSDVLQADYGIANGGADSFEFSELKNVSGSYTVPITPYETTIQVYGNKSDSSVIEDPLQFLGITNRLVRYGATLRQPVYRTANREFAMSVTFERSENKSFFFGSSSGSEIIAPGSINGKMKVSALRLTQEWTDRSQNQVLALRSTVSIGLDVFGVTLNPSPTNDARFVSWLGQAQYVRRLFNTPNLLILRVDGQWTEDPLLPPEQFSVGGANTVRGYRENQLRPHDRGVLASVETRIPVIHDKAGNPLAQVAPFFDFGGGWDVPSSVRRSSETITSAGIGLLLNPNKHISAQLYWGHPFRNFHTSGNDPQDWGLHFKVNVETF